MRGVIRLVILTCFVSAACGDDAPDAGAETLEQRIVGTWVTQSGDYEILDADGTFAAGQTPEEAAGSPMDFGTYTLEGNVFTYVTDPEAEFCTEIVSFEPLTKEGLVGRYEISISDDGQELFRTLIDDACLVRTTDATPSAARYHEGG
jgi:hypothetical protein